MKTDLSDTQFLRICYFGGPQVEFILVEFDIDRRPIGGVLQNITLHDTDRDVNVYRITKTIANLRETIKTILFGQRYGIGTSKLRESMKAHGFSGEIL